MNALAVTNNTLIYCEATDTKMSPSKGKADMEHRSQKSTEFNVTASCLAASRKLHFSSNTISSSIILLNTHSIECQSVREAVT